ncbi:DUF1835 domain-containing protein [Clostridium massiliodielmoense]|uniref:DUF1835 domain-containing protein n=1 Tax=Clostridium massiliodielmoense TaxID=1776385 RepID=UPI0004DAAF28|nr:DUF1835 domain-containing protein [Clostridium massiliodielmoense]KEH99098.1 hypothetical protein Z962_06175 [Clostridium botulinum C/D str. BKT12695]
MNNVIHMCFSASASGSFKFAIKENIIKGSKVISFYDNLSEGKIGDLKNLYNRVEWYKSIGCVEKNSKEDIYEYKRDYDRYRRKVAKLTDKGLEMLSNDKEAIEFWKEKECEIDKDREYVRSFREECALKEKLNIARNLLDILDVEIIAEKTGLTIEQVKNLETVISK